MPTEIARYTIPDRHAPLARRGELAHVLGLFNQRKGGDPMSNEISVLVKGFGSVVILTGQTSS